MARRGRVNQPTHKVRRLRMFAEELEIGDVVNWTDEAAFTTPPTKIESLVKHRNLGTRKITRVVINNTIVLDAKAEVIMLRLAEQGD